MNNQWIKKIIAVTAIATITSGCAMYRLEELRHTTPSGSPFQKELAKLYMDFAAQDEKGYDWFNSWYFADKGLRAAYGKEVMPEEPKDWDIPKEALPDLQDAHGKLLVALTPKNEEAHPQSAAQAQVYFDCWIQRQEEGWQTGRIEYCRNGFSQALDELSAPVEKPAVVETKTLKPHKHKNKKTKKTEPKVDAEGNNIEPVGDHSAEQKPKAEKTSKSESAETLSYVVFFAGERAVITDPGEQVLADVIKSLKKAGDYEIVLKSGAGSDSSSKLFGERAAAVTKRLTEGGIKPESIATGTGKGDAGRHVEIFISQ